MKTRNIKCVGLSLVLFSSFFLGSISCTKLPKEKLFSLLDSTITKVNFANILKEDTAFNIIEYLYFYNGGGIATGDINNDGLVDLYFTSNQNSNKLYVNKGGFVFEDITNKANAQGVGNWKTGVTMADVNGDGFLDIYICGVGNYKKFNSRNQLLINNGDLTFTDRTIEYGLDFCGFSTQAIFFDYDVDGDLDCYLLNHSVHSTRSLGNATERFVLDTLAGDRLYRNDLYKDHKKGSVSFFEVTKSAGILSGSLGYGLGVGVSDLNLDGYPDIYVSNDFQENDYLYLNKKDGTFKQILESSLGHSSKFSMGNDIADINNDGKADILSLDMMPNEEAVIKTSAGDDPFEIYKFKLKSGFHYQTARNCLQLNQFISDSSLAYSDIAWMTGVAATDWSWAPLMADFDNDGFKDIVVTNGILRRPNDMDYISYISNQGIQNQLQEVNKSDVDIINQMPSGRVSNFIFKNSGHLNFYDSTSEWGLNKPSLSNGAAYADLDNDGDLDLIINNINEQAFLYRNNTTNRSYLKISFSGNVDFGNRYGYGTKLACYSKGKLQMYEVSSSRGFCSSVDSRINIGLNELNIIDSILIIWPSGKFEKKVSIKCNQTLTAYESDALNVFDYKRFNTNATLLRKVSKSEIPKFSHKEDDFNAFNYENLMPQMLTTQGPPLVVADVNNDQLDDIFVGGGKGQSDELYLQSVSGFQRSSQQVFKSDSSAEDISSAFFDADSDGDNDLIIVSGGQNATSKRNLLKPRLYLNNGKGIFSKSEDFVPNLIVNGSCVRPFDFDKDGDIDLFIGASTMPLLYGMSPESYLLINHGKGNFTILANWLGNSSFNNMPYNRPGMVKDAIWSDVNKDGLTDLIVVGEWMPITVLMQQKDHTFLNQTEKLGLGKTAGLWNTIAIGDFDSDGLEDLVVGNLGLNSRLKANELKPLKMLLGDFDGNGSSDHIILYYNGDTSYPLATRDQLVRQLPYLKKKFLFYKDYRNVNVEDILTPAQAGQSAELRINQLQSVVARNNGNGFTLSELPFEAQTAPVMAICVEDINEDGKLDIILGGNLKAVQTELGPYDAGFGMVLLGKGDCSFNALSPSQSGFFIQGETRSIKIVKNKKNEKLILVARNNDTLLGFKK